MDGSHHPSGRGLGSSGLAQKPEEGQPQCGPRMSAPVRGSVMASGAGSRLCTNHPPDRSEPDTSRAPQPLHWKEGKGSGSDVNRGAGGEPTG